MIIYQLVAKGGMICFDRIQSIYSKRVFKDKIMAEKYRDKFKEICCRNDINDLNPDTTTVKIIELELE